LIALGTAFMLLAVLPRPKLPRTNQQVQVLLGLVMKTPLQQRVQSRRTAYTPAAPKVRGGAAHVSK